MGEWARYQAERSAARRPILQFLLLLAAVPIVLAVLIGMLLLVAWIAQALGPVVP